jgi:TonB family protein
MRKFKKLYYLLGLILLVNSFVAAKEEIVIESRLFKGTREEGKPGPEVIITSYSEPFIVPIHPSKAKSESKFISYLKQELNSIYQLKDVDLLATAKMIWDGEKKGLNETILFDEVFYSINLSPQMHSQNNINLRIVIWKYKGPGISLWADKIEMIGKGKERIGLFKNVNKVVVSGGEGYQALDTEIMANFNEPVVLGFPSNGQPYFLSLHINKREVKEVLGGVVSGVIGSIQAKDPVCGKWVGRGAGFEKENRAIATYKYKGETYFFCSKECLEKFKKNPEKYIKKIAAEPEEKSIKAEILTSPPKPIYHINPIYPEHCKKEMIQGMVTLEITIDKEGKVGRIKVLNSPHPDLSQAAIDAIKQWKYEMVIRDGKRVPAVFPVTIHFKIK